MFGIGILELVLIAVVFIIFVGPKKLPEVMRQFGKIFVQAKRMSNEVKSTFDTVVYEAERELHLENLKKIESLTKGSLSTHLQDVINTADLDGSKKLEQKDQITNNDQVTDAVHMDLNHPDHYLEHKNAESFERPLSEPNDHKNAEGFERPLPETKFVPVVEVKATEKKEGN